MFTFLPCFHDSLGFSARSLQRSCCVSSLCLSDSSSYFDSFCFMDDEWDRCAKQGTFLLFQSLLNWTHLVTLFFLLFEVFFCTVFNLLTWLYVTKLTYLKYLSSILSKLNILISSLSYNVNSLGCLIGVVVLVNEIIVLF